MTKSTKRRKVRFTPWLEHRAQKLIESYKRPAWGGSYFADKGAGTAFCEIWERPIKNGHWDGAKTRVQP